MNKTFKEEEDLAYNDFFKFLEKIDVIISQKNKISPAQGVCSYSYHGVYLKRKIEGILREYFIKKGEALEVERNMLLSTKSVEASGHLESELRMFKIEDENLYLQAETTQSVMEVSESYRIRKGSKKLLTLSKVFRNEPSPRLHQIRSREFTVMELQILSRKDQQKIFNIEEDSKYIRVLEKDNISLKTIEEMEEKEGQKLAQVLFFTINGLQLLGFHKRNIYVMEVEKEDRAFYSTKTYDIYFRDGERDRHVLEIGGIAIRTNHDLTRNNLKLAENYEHHEISLGIDRILLCLLRQSYEVGKDGNLTYLNLRFEIKLYDFALARIVTNNEQVLEITDILYEKLGKEYNILYLKKGSIGARYYEADSLGIPYTVVADFETVETNTLTVRTIRTREQKRIPVQKLHTITTENPIFEL